MHQKMWEKNVSKNRGHFLLDLHTHVNALTSELQISLTNINFYEIKHWLFTFLFILQVKMTWFCKTFFYYGNLLGTV